MTLDQIDEVDAALQRGEKPEDVARRLGITRTAMNYQLLVLGKRIVTYRRLENTAPVDKPRELAAA